MAYNEGYTTAEITTSQFVLGIIGILLINLFQKTKKKTQRYKRQKQNIFQLMLAGTSLGMTSILLLFSRKIYSCFHWDCIVDAKRGWECYSKCSRKEPSTQKW
jgi:hypothetical protein